MGAMLYELLTGRPPFVSSTKVVDLDRKLKEDGPSAPSTRNPQLPGDLDLDHICAKCLARDPAHRYQTAAELALDLRRKRAGERLVPRPSWWQWLRSKSDLSRPLRDEDYFKRHTWKLLREATTALAGHVGFFLLLSAGMPGQALWACLLVTEFLGGWVNWLWDASRRTFSPMERDVLQLWAGFCIVCFILMSLHCPLWGPVEPTEAVRFYPAWAAVLGMVYFIEGRLCWSRLYYVGFLFFAAALALPLTGLWAPVVYGLLYSGTFVWFSLLAPSGTGAKSLASQTTVTHP
jgi:serine/threonine-protein kinase